MDTFVGAILVDFSNDILLIKEDDMNQIGKGRWNLPGGRVKVDESLQDALYRETMEETGFKCDVNELLGMYVCNKGEVFWNYLVFKAVAIRWNRQELSDPDVKTAKWFNKADFDKLDDSELVHPDIRLLYNNVFSNTFTSLNITKRISY